MLDGPGAGVNPARPTALPLRYPSRSVRPRPTAAGDEQGIPLAGPNPIQIRRIDHVVLRIRDLEASLRFWRDALGCPVERAIDGLGLVQLRAGDSLIDLVPIDGPLGQAGGGAPGADGRNVDHVALSLTHFDEAKLRAHLEQHGIEPGDVSPRYGADGSGPSMYIRDPDGNTIELKGPADR
jgi:catechol 2,3-dioxygenase-like lactoylglutathione lyase family enzyme